MPAEPAGIADTRRELCASYCHYLSLLRAPSPLKQIPLSEKIAQTEFF